MLLEKAAFLQKELRSKFVDTEGVNILVEKIDLSDATAVKTLVHNLEKEIGNTFIVFGNIANGKPMLTVGISADLAKAKNLNAGNIVRELAKEIKGGGGGQATFATAGGTDASGLDSALSKAKTILK